MARAVAAAGLTFLSILLLSGSATAQAPRKSMPAGSRIVAHDGDTIVLEDDARVRLVRQREANARVIFDARERWVVILADFATDGGPDGRADWTYYFRDVTGKWPLDDRWEGRTTIEEYTMAGSVPGGHGVGFVTPRGLVQLWMMPRNDSDSADAASVLTYANGGGSAGGGRSFDEIEPMQIANAQSRTGTTLVQTPAGIGSVSMQAQVGSVRDRPATIDGQQPVRVGGTVQQPEKLVDVAPVKPETAERAGIRGTVILELTIGVDGRVGDARVLRSVPLLDEAALEAARQWRYAPTLLNGQTVPVILTVPVVFR